MPIHNAKYPQYSIPRYIKRKLIDLGAKLVELDPGLHGIHPDVWHWLALDDTTLDYVLVRSTTSRLSDRDAEVVRLWQMTNSTFHCIRDHPSHANLSIVPDAFGAKPRELTTLLRTSISDLLHTKYPRKVDSKKQTSLTDSLMYQQHFLHDFIWPAVSNSCICHDSISCFRWPNTKPFPVGRTKLSLVQHSQDPAPVEFITAPYNEHHRWAYDVALDANIWRQYKFYNKNFNNMCTKTKT